MKLPITQEHIDEAIKRIEQRKTSLKVIKRTILPLDQAAKRLNDDKVWSRASKGFRFKDE